MKFRRLLSKSFSLPIVGLIGFISCCDSAWANNKELIKQGEKKALSFNRPTDVNYGSYILGPGDGIEIELLDLPELGGFFSIGPDGSLYLPRLRALYVEGLTIEELSEFLTQRFKSFVRDPKVYVRPVAYRPIRIYVGGEVKRPGYYTLSGTTYISGIAERAEIQGLQRGTKTNSIQQLSIPVTKSESLSLSNRCSSTFGAIFPTVFDAICSAEGITPYTDLTQVQVIRKRAAGMGGGRIRTHLNFLSLITDGDESQNIRLYDGDVVNISKSPVVLRDQLLKAGQTNLSPRLMEVFVTGRVNTPGGVLLPQGSTLNQAISLAGGIQLLKGKIEFVRLNSNGSIDRRVFAYQASARVDESNNPVLVSGDLIRVQESPLSAGVDLLNQLTGPFVGIYSVYSLFNGASQ